MTNTVPNIMLVTPAELPGLISRICVDEHDVLVIHGQPGGGKSEVVQQAGALYDCTIERGNFCDVRLSQREAVDTRGMPDINRAEKLTEWYAPAEMPFIGNKRFEKFKNGKIFLFLDEFASTSESVMVSIYQLLNDRAIGEHKLMPNVVIVCATNREGDKGVVNKIPTPVKNRVVHVELALDPDSFCAHAIKMGYALGAAYIAFRQQMLSTFMVWDEKLQKHRVTTNMAFATPRAWFKAFRYWDNNDMTLRQKTVAICGAVGVGEGNDFISFAKIRSNIISIKKIMADPENCELPQAADLRYAVACNVSGNMTVKTVNKLAIYLARMDPEMTILAWKLALMRDTDLFNTDEYTEYAEQYAEAFGAIA
jgi:hypothetical protein